MSNWNDSWSTEMEEAWFSSDDKEFMKMDNSKGFFAAFGIMAILTVFLNVAFWGGLIYFAFWCAKHFGVI